MAIEFERKWLVVDQEWQRNVSVVSTERIRQAYLYNKDKIVVRVRAGEVHRPNAKDVKNFRYGAMTCKGPSSVNYPDEYEKDIPFDFADKIIADYPIIEKTRYVVPYGDDICLEIDVFGGKLTGLIVAEVEFASLEESESFVAPNWFMTEVTHDSKYSNANLLRAML